MTHRIVIMGVSGCGKSSVGVSLGKHLGIACRDGDDLHPAANVDQMRAGIPLCDEDRCPWLDRVARVLKDNAPVIVGCSALRRAYRDRIRSGAGGAVRFVHLAGSREVIATRMAARAGHYMPATLLDSQFATLEAPKPDEALTLDITVPRQSLVDAILAEIKGNTA